MLLAMIAYGYTFLAFFLMCCFFWRFWPGLLFAKGERVREKRAHADTLCSLNSCMPTGASGGSHQRIYSSICARPFAPIHPLPPAVCVCVFSAYIALLLSRANACERSLISLAVVLTDFLVLSRLVVLYVSRLLHPLLCYSSSDCPL